MPTNVPGKRARRKQAAMRKALSGEMEELCCCGMVEV